MKTKRTKTKHPRPDKNHRAGLVNCLNENPRTRRELNELKLFFLEDSLTDYQFSYQSHQISY